MAVIKCKYLQLRCPVYGGLCEFNITQDCPYAVTQDYRTEEGLPYYPTVCPEIIYRVAMFEKKVNSFVFDDCSLTMRGLEIYTKHIIKLIIDGEVILDREEANE
jgi:hypothetical protein